MAKEVFNRNVGHENIGEISTGNNIGGSTREFWNRMADSIENNTKGCYADYKGIDATPEERDM